MGNSFRDPHLSESHVLTSYKQSHLRKTTRSLYFCASLGRGEADQVSHQQRHFS